MINLSKPFYDEIEVSGNSISSPIESLIVPLGIRVVLKIDTETFDVSKFGIHQTADHEAVQVTSCELGTVVSIGNMVAPEYIQGLKVGDKALFRKFTGLGLKYESGEFFRVVNDSDIFLKFMNGGEKGLVHVK